MLAGGGKRIFHAQTCPSVALAVNHRDRNLDTASQESFDLKSLSNICQPKSAQLALLQELDASKHHEGEWEKLWHPWAGEKNDPGRHWKCSNQLSKPVIFEQPHPQQAAGWTWSSLRGWV